MYKRILARVLGVIAAAVMLVSATDADARLPKPIQVTGVVLAIDYDTRTLVLKIAKNQKPFVLDWDDSTQFIKDGQSANASVLRQNTMAAVHYKRLSFRNPRLKKIIWEGSPQN